MIRIIFSKPIKPKFTSEAIMWKLGTNYSHVAIEFRMSYHHKTLIFEASRGSVKAVSYGNWIKKNSIVDVAYIKEISAENRRELVRYLIDQLDKKYGYWTILGILFPKLNIGLDGDKTFICSELIAKCLSLAYNYNVGKKADYITPLDVKNIIAELETVE